MKENFYTFCENTAKTILQAWYVLQQTCNISRVYILLQFLSCILNTACPLFITYCSGKLLDVLLTADPLRVRNSIILVAIILLAGAFYSSVKIILSQNITLLQMKVNHSFSMQIHKKTVEMDYAYIEDKAVHEQRELAIGGIGKMGGVSGYLQCIFSIIRSILTIGAVLIAFWNRNIFVLVFILIMRVCSIYWEKHKKQKSFEFDQTNDKMNLIYSYTYFLTHDHKAAKEARVFDLVPLYRKMMGDFQKQSYEINKKRSLTDWKYTVYLSIMQHGYLFLAYIIFALQVIIFPAVFTIGSMSISIGYADQFNEALGSIVSQCLQLFYNSKYIAQYRAYLERQDDIERSGIAKLPATDGEHVFVFDNVSFRYPGTEEYILKNINCEIRNGQKTALVGENGSGKSTFIKLLVRLYDPTEGTIYLNGKDIKSYSYDEYHTVFAAVFQDFAVMPYSVRENINVSSEWEVNDPAVWSALGKVGISGRIKTLPCQENTYIQSLFQEKGVNFSGGELQKIAIARALYRDSPVMILDEPTAALDPRAEYEIFQMYRQLVRNKTAVLISHRLSSCRLCDTILVFQKGNIVQQGNHDNLVSTDGLYSEMWKAQAQYYI